MDMHINENLCAYLILIRMLAFIIFLLTIYVHTETASFLYCNMLNILFIIFKLLLQPN